LHVAVYKNSVHVEKIVKLLLDWNSSSDCSHTSSIDARKKCSLASIPMKCGSCPLHIVTGQNLTIKEELLKTLLSADSSVVLKEDANGDNPLSLLWKNTLVSREKKIRKNNHKTMCFCLTFKFCNKIIILSLNSSYASFLFHSIF
jgi:hypothetical protein